jgi:hypothetical protein
VNRERRLPAEPPPKDGPRSRPRWTWVLLVLALAVVVLSFVPGWLVHERELRGEGYRTFQIGLTAWQLRSGSLPVIGGGILVSLAVGVAAVALPGLRRWLVVGIGVAAGLLAAGLLPIGRLGHITHVWLYPGWLLTVGIAIVAVMAAGALRGARPGRRVLVTAAIALVLAGIAGGGVRLLQLELTEGADAHWSDGSYVRVDGAPGELILDDGTFALGEWGGRMEPAGINVILTDDPGCPAARGFYRVRTVDDGVLWEKVVDTCADGARTDDLGGVWRRVP